MYAYNKLSSTILSFVTFSNFLTSSKYNRIDFYRDTLFILNICLLLGRGILVILICINILEVEIDNKTFLKS